MLDPETAKQLEKRVMDRLADDPGDKFTLQFRRIAARAAIIALQEYERMKDDQKS